MRSSTAAWCCEHGWCLRLFELAFKALRILLQTSEMRYSTSHVTLDARAIPLLHHSCWRVTYALIGGVSSSVTYLGYLLVMHSYTKQRCLCLGFIKGCRWYQLIEDLREFQDIWPDLCHIYCHIRWLWGQCWWWRWCPYLLWTRRPWSWKQEADYQPVAWRREPRSQQ